MSNILTILDEAIDKKFKIQNISGKVIFEEKQREQNKCKKVEISISSKVFAMSLDNGEKVFNCFDDSLDEDKNLNKKNDGILIFEYKDKIIVLLIELKSFNEGKYLKQIKSGKNFMEYLFKQIELFYPISLNNKVCYFGILFKLFKQIPSKNPTKREKINFTDKNGLLTSWIKCNSSYKLQQIKESIKVFL